MDVETALDRTLTTIANSYREELDNDICCGPIEGAFSYGASDAARFCRTLLKVREILGVSPMARPTFLDVGCGPGITLVMAHHCGFKATGLELDKPTIALAKKLLQYSCLTGIRRADILKYRRYGDYDVIFMFNPLCDHKLKTQLEERVLRQAEPGALIITSHCGETYWDNKQVETIERSHACGMFRKL